MKRLMYSSIIAGALAFAAPAVAPANAIAAQKAPKNATAQCKDGTYSTAKTKRGACSGHGGIGAWLADTATSASDAEKEPRQPKAASKATAASKEKAPSKDASRPTAAPVKPSTSAKAPANAGDPTAQCNDGTYSYAAHHQGACSGHQGVKTWFK